MYFVTHTLRYLLQDDEESFAAVSERAKINFSRTTRSALFETIMATTGTKFCDRFLAAICRGDLSTQPCCSPPVQCTDTIRRIGMPTAASQAYRPPSITINGFGLIGKSLVRTAIQNNYFNVSTSWPRCNYSYPDNLSENTK